jgi:hypothetical protein
MPAKYKKHTRRGRKLSRKMRKTRTRRMRGGGNIYTFTVATPISPTSTATGFPAELGTFSAGNQSISFTNPTKSIVDIKVKNGATAYGASSFATWAGTKVALQVGSKQNLVPNGVTVRGATALPGAAAATGMTGAVTVKGLGASSFGTMPPVLTFEVFTSN